MGNSGRTGWGGSKKEGKTAAILLDHGPGPRMPLPLKQWGERGQDLGTDTGENSVLPSLWDQFSSQGEIMGKSTLEFERPGFKF